MVNKPRRMDEVKAKKELQKLRTKIDRADRNIVRELHKRWKVAGKLKALKKRYGIKIVEDARIKEMKQKHVTSAKKYYVPEKVVDKVFTVIVKESLKFQKGK